MRLEQLPDTGRVMLAHPSRALIADLAAEREGLDVLLRELVPPDSLYVLDLDAVNRRMTRPEEPTS